MNADLEEGPGRKRAALDRRWWAETTRSWKWIAAECHLGIWTDVLKLLDQKKRPKVLMVRIVAHADIPAVKKNMTIWVTPLLSVNVTGQTFPGSRSKHLNTRCRLTFRGSRGGMYCWTWSTPTGQ